MVDLRAVSGARRDGLLDLRGDVLFAVTFADGQRVGKILDVPIGTPMARACDRTTRDAVASIGDDLAKRYFP